MAQHGQSLYFFYPSENRSALKYRIWQDGHFSPENTLHTGIKLPFSVFHQEDVLSVFCQDTQGNIMLFSHRNGTWGNRTILKGSKNILLTPMLSEDNLCIVYNGTAEADTSYLYKRSATSAGQWQEAETIDHFKPFAFTPYEAQITGPGHMLLFYQTQAEECQVGYREVTPKRTGSFHRFLNAQGSLVDASYLTTQDTVHLLMVVKTVFSCQLLYRKKTEDVFTPPALLWESPRIENCLLTIIENELHATCMAGGRLHFAISLNDGDAFGPMEPYKRKFCTEPIKASFVTQNYGQMTRQGWFARHVYVDKAAPWDIQMLPDLCPNFYALAEKREASSQMRELEDRLTAAQLALDAKDRQILELLYKSKTEDGI